MTGDESASELIKVCVFPAMPVPSSADNRRRICNSATNDNVRAELQAFDDTSRAKINIRSNNWLSFGIEKVGSILSQGDLVVLFVEMSREFAGVLYLGSDFVKQVVARNVGDFQVILVLSNQLLTFHSKTFGIKGAAIDDDLDPFLVEDIQALLQTIPGCWFPAVVLSHCQFLCVFSQIYLCKVVTRDKINISLSSLAPHLISGITSCS